AIACPAAAVVPAARVLRHVAADGALIADLRRRHQLRRFHQQRVLLADDGMLDDLGQRSHRADLDASAGLPHALELPDLAQIDDDLRPLDPILEQIHAVEPARQHPRISAVLVEQLDRIVYARGLVQLEDRDDVANNGHMRWLSVMRMSDFGMRGQSAIETAIRSTRSPISY